MEIKTERELFINRVDHREHSYRFNEKPLDLKLADEFTAYKWKMFRIINNQPYTSDPDYVRLLTQIRAILYESGILNIKGVKEFLEPKPIPNNRVTKICIICGSKFDTADPDREGCSIRCMDKIHGRYEPRFEKEGKCKFCGKPFMKYRRQDFCSYECRKEYQRNKTRERQRDERKRNR